MSSSVAMVAAIVSLPSQSHHLPCSPSLLLSVLCPPAGSSVISCVSCFFLSFGNSESAMIALLCLFGGISIASWNALDVLTVELYPSDKR